MREIAPGVFHWTAPHPRIRIRVSSYWIDPAGVLVDPLVPPDAGLGWFGERPTRPQAVLLTNRHHYRDSGRFADEFGCTVHCNRAGLHEFRGSEAVVGFDPGDTLPGNAVAYEVGAICPDETALHFPEQRALAVADGVVRGGPDSALGFVPDAYMDEPEETKRALLAAYARLLDEIELEHLLLAHGAPVIGNGRELLQAFVAQGADGA
jgi:hypothetical protein